VTGEWEAIDRAEERLAAHSAERRTWLERRDRRRRRLPWLLAPLVLPALGAAAFLAVLERAGGDLRGWPTPAALGLVAACLAVPAALAAFATRREGALEAAAWALVSVCAEIALVVGVGFLLLELGPS
jgi:hypothetical protein